MIGETTKRLFDLVIKQQEQEELNQLKKREEEKQKREETFKALMDELIGLAETEIAKGNTDVEMKVDTLIGVYQEEFLKYLNANGLAGIDIDIDQTEDDDCDPYYVLVANFKPPEGYGENQGQKNPKTGKVPGVRGKRKKQ